MQRRVGHRSALARSAQRLARGYFPLVPVDRGDFPNQPMRFMVDSGEGRDTDSPERLLQRRGAAEFIGMVFHGYSIPHVDAPSHYFWDGKLYNGRSCNLVTSREGATAASIEVLRSGVVSRGVLLDVARARGVEWLPPGEGGIDILGILKRLPADLPIALEVPMETLTREIGPEEVALRVRQAASRLCAGLRSSGG